MPIVITFILMLLFSCNKNGPDMSMRPATVPASTVQLSEDLQKISEELPESYQIALEEMALLKDEGLLSQEELAALEKFSE